MKKAIGIYLIGVALSWVMGFGLINKWKNEYGTKFTYGDIAMISGLSIFSWINVAAVSITWIGEFDFWDKPINP